MKHIILGKTGESRAKKFLKKNKYKILHTNYKNVLGEIDIVAKQKNVLIFVEVKTRTSQKFGRASEAVGPRKQKKIRDVATLYLKQNKMLDNLVRFDVLEVYETQINHIINAF